MKTIKQTSIQVTEDEKDKILSSLIKTRHDWKNKEGSEEEKKIHLRISEMYEDLYFKVAGINIK